MGKKKKKKQPWETVNREFSKFSSGSDGTGLEDEDLGDLEEMYHEIEEERDILFKSDHEFSCESEDEDDKIEVKHARTGAAKRKKDEEEEVFACKKCGKLSCSCENVHNISKIIWISVTTFFGN